MLGYCADCGQESTVIIVNQGIGAYEFWGFQGYDYCPEALSYCCHAPVYKDEQLTRMITPKDVKGGFIQI